MTMSSLLAAIGEPLTEMLKTLSLWRGSLTAGVLGSLRKGGREWGVNPYFLFLENVMRFNFTLLLFLPWVKAWCD